MNESSASIALYGLNDTIQGMCDISEGELKEGSLKVINGLTEVTIGSFLHENGNLKHSYLHASLELGAITVVSKGSTKLIQGIKNRDLKATIRGTLQTATGCAAIVYLNCLPARTIAVAHQALSLSFASAYVSWVGVQDLINNWVGVQDLINNKDRDEAIGKILFGMTGILTAGCYAYSEFFPTPEIAKTPLPFYEKTLPPQLNSFVSSHEHEITEMFATKRVTGNWTQLGEGASKKAYIHPDTDFVLKVPHKVQSAWGFAETDVVIHYKGLQKAEHLVKRMGFDQLVVPEAYLIQGPEFSFVLEKKFQTISYVNVPIKPATYTAKEQLNALIEEGEYCDISVNTDHNAGFLNNTENKSMIGIFDFDCQTQLTLKDINILKPLQKTQKNIIESASYLASVTLVVKRFVRPEQLAEAATLIYTMPAKVRGIASRVFSFFEFYACKADDDEQL
jgi:hypothetical protein